MADNNLLDVSDVLGSKSAPTSNNLLDVGDILGSTSTPPPVSDGESSSVDDNMSMGRASARQDAAINAKKQVDDFESRREQGIKDYYQYRTSKDAGMPDTPNEEGSSMSQQFARQNVKEIATAESKKTIDYLKRRDVPFHDKQALVGKIMADLQKEKSLKTAEVDKQYSYLDRKLSNIPGSEIFQGGIDENDQMIVPYSQQVAKNTKQINDIQAMLGAGGGGGAFSVNVETEGENAKAAIANANAFDGMSDDQLKQNAGITGVQVRNIAKVNSDGSIGYKYVENAYKRKAKGSLPLELTAIPGVGTLVEAIMNPILEPPVNPIESMGYQRDGIYQDIGALNDHVKQKQEDFKGIVTKHNELVKAYNDSPSLETDKALTDYDNNTFDPASSYIDKQIKNIQRLEGIAKDGFKPLEASEKAHEDMNAKYVKALETVHRTYDDSRKTSGRFVSAIKTAAESEFLELYAPAITDVTANELMRVGWGLGTLVKTPFTAAATALGGDKELYNTDLYSSESRLRDELLPLPDAYLNPKLIYDQDKDHPGGVMQRINWVESGPLALKTTLQSLEIVAATSLTGGALTSAGLFGTEAGALTAAMKASILPVTAAMTYGDFLYNNMESGMNPTHASALSAFQSLVEGVTERISPLEAKIFNPEYWSTHAITYETRRGVMRSLFKSLTGKELTEVAEKSLLESSKKLFANFSKDTLLNFGVTGVKGLAEGAYTVAQETAEEVAADLLNAPIDKVADQYIQGYNYTPLSGDSLLYTSITSAVTMLPTGLWGAGASVLHKQAPGFRLQIAENASVFNEMLKHDFETNKISKKQYDLGKAEISRIWELAKTHQDVLHNLDEKVDRAEYINALVSQDKYMQHVGASTNLGVISKEGLLVPFLTQVPETIPVIENGKTVEKPNTEKRTNAELQAIELQKYEDYLHTFRKKAYDNMSLSKEEKLQRNEDRLLNATKEKFTDDFIDGLWDERQIKFHQADLAGRVAYMRTDKMSTLADEINPKLEARIAQLKQDEIEAKEDAIRSSTPRTETITLNGKTYNVTYSDDFTTEEYKNADGTPVEDETELQALYDHLEAKVAEKIKTGKTPKAVTQVAIKTKSGVKQIQIGKKYFLGKVISEDADGHKLFRFPEVTVLGQNEDGTINIQETGKKPRTVSPSVLADYKLGTKEQLKKSPAAMFYFNNSNVVFSYKFGKGKKVTGRLEYDSDKNELLFVYKDAKGKVQEKELTEKDLVPQFIPGSKTEKYKEARLEPVEDKDGKPLDLLYKEQVRIQQEAAAKANFAKAKERMLERRSNILETFLKAKEEAVDKIKAKLALVDSRLETNAKDMESTQKELAFLWKQRDAGFKGVSKAKVAQKIADLLEFGRNLKIEKSELEESFKALQEKLDRAMSDLVATQDVVDEFDLEDLEDPTSKFSTMLEGKLSEYRKALNEARKFLKSSGEVLSSLEKTIQAIKDFITSLFEAIEKNYPGLLDVAPELMNDYINNNITKSYEAKQKIAKDLKQLDDEIEGIENKEKDLENLHKEIEKSRRVVNEFQPKVRVLAQLVREVRVKQAAYDSSIAQKRREAAKKKLGMENKAVSDSSSDVHTGDPTEDRELVPYSEAQKALEILFNSTVTPDQLKDPAVARLNSALNKLGSPIVKDDKVVANTHVKPFHKLLLITKDNAAKYGLEAIVHDDNHIVAVLVANYADGVKFIGEDLENLDAPTAENVVYASLPVAELVWSKGTYEGQNRYHEREKTTDEHKKALVDEYEADRNKILSDIKANPDTRVMFPIITVSEGFTVSTNKNANEPIQGRLLTQEAYDAAVESGLPLIVIPTTRDPKNPKVGTVFAGERSVNMPIGRPVLRLGSAIRFLNNRKLTANEKGVIKGLLQLLVIRATRNTEEGKEAILDQDILEFLKRVLYWRIPDSADAAMGRNQIYLETYDGDARLVLGHERVEVPFTLDEIQTSVLLDTFLNEAFNNVDTNLLNALAAVKDKKKVDKVVSFFEITSVDVEEDKFDGRKWNTYQEYLLSNKNPDGTDRPANEIPLTTNVDPISSDPSNPNIKGRYFIFSRDAQAKPEETIATETKDPESTNIVYNGQVYKRTHKGVNSNETIPLLRENNPNRIFVSTFKNGTVIKYVTIDGAPVVQVIDAVGRTKTLEEISELFNNSLQGDIAIHDTLAGIAGGKFDEGASKFTTEVFEKTNETVETTQTDTTPPSTSSAKEKAAKRRKRVSDSMDSNTRLMTQKKFYETEDFQAFKKWFEANFPDSITAEQVPFVIDGIAMGQFKNNAIRIYKNAEKGTGYHEAFEAVWNAFLSPVEREALLNEFKRRSGSFTEYNTGKKIKYSDATISQAKEEMAEEFRRFRLTGEQFKGAVKQNHWFRRFLNFLRNIIFGKPATISELQDRMANAYFKTRSTKRSSRLPLFRSSQNYRSFNPTDLHSIKFFVEVMDGMTAFMLSRLSQTPGSIPAILRGGAKFNHLYHDLKFDLQKHFIGKGEFYQKFFPLYQAGDYEGIIDLIDSSSLEDTSLQLSTIFDIYNNDISNASNPIEEQEALDSFKESLDDVTKQWEKINNDYASFVVDHKEHLEQYNLKFGQDEGVTEEEKYTNEYAEDALAINTKDNSSSAIKLLIGSLVEKKIKPNGQIVDVRSEITRLPKLVDYGQTWATLLNELAGTRNVEEQIAKLKELIPTHPEFSKLIEKLGTFSTEMSPEQMELRIQFEGVFHKVRPNYFRFIYNTEMDEKGHVTGYKLYRLNSNTENEIEKIRNQWTSTMREKNFITTDSSGNKVINISKLAAFEVKNNDFETNKKWLKYIGWDFDAKLTSSQIEDFNTHVSQLRNSLLKETGNILLNQKTFAGRLRSLAFLYVKAKSKFTDTQHFNIEGKPQQNTILDNFVSIHLKDFNNSKNLDEFLDTVPAFRNSAFSKGSLLLKKGGMFFTKNGGRKDNPVIIGVAEGVKMEKDREGRHTSNLYQTERLITEFNHNLHGSYYILVPADIKTEFPIDFGTFFDKDDVKSEKELADKIWNIYSEYLLDEINVIQDYNNRGIGSEFVSFNEKYVSSDKLTKGQQLQLFKDILPDKLVKSITGYANSSNSREDARVYLESHRVEILKGIEAHIDGVTNQTYDDFLSRGLIGYNAKGYMQFYGGDTDILLDTFGKATTFTEKDMRDVFKVRTLNYMTANTEQFKFFFSDPIFWKDALKRTKSFVGNREHTVNGVDASNQFNQWAQNNLNKMQTLDGTVYLRPPSVTDGKRNIESRGFMPYDGRFIKTNIADVTLVSDMYKVLYNEKLDEYSQQIGGKSYQELTSPQQEEVDKLMSTDKDLLNYSPFGDINEADAQGGITLPAFRELLRRGGKWNDYKEILYQYEMSYERQALAASNRYHYTDDALLLYDNAVIDAGDPILKWEKLPNGDDIINQARFQVLKPLKTGYLNNKDILAPSLDKYSLSPMYYRLLEKSENGLSMYNQMMDQGIHYFLFESGTKVGGMASKPGSTSYNKVYDNDGKVVEQQFTAESNDYKYIGIQVETPAKNKTTRGTQLTKQILSNLFNNSVFSAPLDTTGITDQEWRSMTETQRREASDFYRLYRENKDILLAWVETGRTNLFNKLGIKEINGALQFSDSQTVSDFLSGNMKGNKSENIKQALSVEGGKFYLPLDATPVSQKIENIIFSFIDSSVIRPKMFGGSKPQVASTFFERAPRSYVHISDATGKYEQTTDYNSLSQKEKTSMSLTSNDLKFYKEENGKITGIEVYLPWYYSGKVNMDKVDKSLLSGVGFRIPTQSLASVENIIIKGFLPRSMGDSIVVPSEITGKAGSDFDIDKLNLYLFEKMHDGEKYIRIPYLDEENSTPEKRYISYIMDAAERRDLDYMDHLALDYFTKLQTEFQKQFNDIKARLATLKAIDIQEAKDIYTNEVESLEEARDEFKKDYVNELFKTGKSLFNTLEQDLKEELWANHDNHIALGVKGAAAIASHRALVLDMIARDAYTGSGDRQTLTDMVAIYDQQLLAFGNKLRVDVDFKMDKESAKKRLDERKELTKNLFAYKQGKSKKALKAIYDLPATQLYFEYAKEAAKLGDLTTFGEFTKFPMLQQNTEKALKNKYIENLQDLLSSPANKRNLLSPCSARTLMRLADETEAASLGMTVSELKKQKKEELANHSRLLNPNYIAKIRQAFLVGKAGVGITAVNATNHILNTIAGSYLRMSDSAIKFPHNTKVILTQVSSGKTVEMVFPSLAFAKDTAGNWISDNLSEFLNAYVDVAKDPFIITLNAGIKNASTFMFMNKIGIPLDDAAWFMNQPVLKEFTKLDDITRSYHTAMNPFFTQKEDEDENGKKRVRKTNPFFRREEVLRDTFNFDKVNKDEVRTKRYTVTELKKAVTDWHKFQTGKIKDLPDTFYQLQWHIYQDFKKLKDMSQEMTNVISNVKQDTTQFNSLAKVRVMEERFDRLLSRSKYGNLDNYINSLHINAIKDLYPQFLEAFSTLFFTEHPKTRAILDRVLKPIIDTTMGEETYEQAEYISKEFITYVLQTTPIMIDGENRRLSDFIVAMFMGKNNMATRLIELINRMKTGEIDASRALDELSPDIRNNANSTRNIRIWSSKFSAPELNQIYYEFLAMGDSPDPELRKFKDNLVSFILLQSGMNNSPLNFSRFLPIEDFGKVAKAIFAKFENTPERELESFIQQVVANNSKQFGTQVEDRRSIVNSDGLENFDSSNPDLAGSTFILQPYTENNPWRKSIYTNTTADRSISKEDRDAMVAANDWSFLKHTIYMQVVDNEGNPVLYFGDSEKKYYIYREIPPLGDGMYLKEYYATDKESVLKQNNRYRTVGEGEEAKEELIKYPTNSEMVKYLLERKADVDAQNQPVMAQDGANIVDPETADEGLALPPFTKEEEPFMDITKDELLEDYSQGTLFNTKVGELGNPQYKGKPEFNKLPGKSSKPTMTYAGIGSRQTPQEVLSKMTEVAKYLETLGYTLNTGKTFGNKEEGADKAFSDGTSKKNLFAPEQTGERELKIAKELHPNWEALTAKGMGGAKLMGRNTNQVFGENLDTPVDFILFYAEETSNPLRPKGGTGQAVEMARRKGIPTINMANPNWESQLNEVLNGNVVTPKIEEVKGTIETKLIENLIQSGDAVTTVRNEAYHQKFYKGDGVYKTTAGNLVEIKHKGQIVMENNMIVGNGFSYTLNEFGKAEGFGNWKNFQKEAKWAGKTLQQGKPVRLYTITPVEGNWTEVNNESENPLKC